MATKLKSFDFKKQSELTTTDKATYDWDTWLDGDIWQLTAGEDFQTHPLMMERIIRTRATTKGAKVRMRHVGVNGHPWGQIVLQRTDITGPAAIKKAAAAEKRATRRLVADSKRINAPSKVPTKRPAKKAAAAK